MVALSKDVSPSIGVFPWISNWDSAEDCVCERADGDGDGVWDFGLGGGAACSRRYHLGPGGIAFDHERASPDFAVDSSALATLAGGVVWAGDWGDES